VAECVSPFDMKEKVKWYDLKSFGHPLTCENNVMSNPNKYKVYLSEEQRQHLKEISRNGKAPAKKILHARVLLLAAQDDPEGGWTDEKIGAALGLHSYSVARIRKRFVTQGEAPALNRQMRLVPPRPAKLDGEKEAQLIAICCSPAPCGRNHWTLSLLVNELKARRIVTEISRETVRQTLKKMNYDLGKNSATVFQKKIQPAL
jgi:transposase